MSISNDEGLENILSQMVVHQRKKVYDFSKKLVPFITTEDILQPQDYPELYYNVDFRYEEGLLHGLEGALSAVRAQLRMNEIKKYQ